MRHRDTGELRYFHSSANNSRFLDMPLTVEKEEDFDKFIEKLEVGDFLEYARQSRPDSSWVVDQVTNLSLYFNHLEFLIKVNTAPDHIKHRKGVITVDSENNMCFFHALAIYKDKSILDGYTKSRNLKTKDKALELYTQYTQTPCHEFDGVSSDSFESLEDCYKVGIRIYMLEKRGSEYIAILQRRPNPLYDEVIDLDLSQNLDGDMHFSYIHDIKQYSHTFKCASCGQRWPSAWACSHHART